VCKIGYALTPGAAADRIPPKTGVCVELTSANGCDFPEACMTNAEDYTICPYCKTYKDHTLWGVLSMGEYVKGSGTATPDDPMIFENGDSDNCGNGEDRSSKGYWYCWYDRFPSPPNQLVPLDSYFVYWLENPLCHYKAYIYTPLACQTILV